MFALPSDYVAAQDAGKSFAADYFGRLNASADYFGRLNASADYFGRLNASADYLGRLNASAESVVDMFTERSRYYSMDSLNGRPAVGRADIVRELRRFLRTYSGGHRFVNVVSVDAQIDVGHGDQATRNFGHGDSDDSDNDDFDDPYLAVFVRAEWVDAASGSLAPLPFVQTFRVRCLRAAVHGHRFKIVITIVKILVAAVQPLLQGHQPQRRLHGRLDANLNGFSNSELGGNDYKTPITGQFKQESYASYKKLLNAEAQEFELWSDSMSPPPLEAQSTDDEQEPSDESVDEQESIREQYMTYQNKVKAFLKKPMTDHQSSTRAAATEDDDDDDENRPTHVLRVDRVEKSITADQLFAAFSRYGKVLWVKVFPGGYNWPSGSVYPYHSARVYFDRTESVDRVLADHQDPGCTINGVLVSFSKS